MVTLMGWPLLGDEESGQKKHRHGEEKAIPGWATSADTLLQLGNKRVKFIWKKNREKEKGDGGRVMSFYKFITVIAVLFYA